MPPDLHTTVPLASRPISPVSKLSSLPATPTRIAFAPCSSVSSPTSPSGSTGGAGGVGGGEGLRSPPSSSSNASSSTSSATRSSSSEQRTAARRENCAGRAIDVRAPGKGLSAIAAQFSEAMGMELVEDLGRLHAEDLEDSDMTFLRRWQKEKLMELVQNIIAGSASMRESLDDSDLSDADTASVGGEMSDIQDDLPVIVAAGCVMHH